MYADMITMLMLIKLFATSMVASKRSGISISFNKSLLFLERDLRNFSRSLGLKEKNATSAPETSAEDNKRNSTTKIAARILTETGFISISAIEKIPDWYGSVMVSNMN